MISKHQSVSTLQNVNKLDDPIIMADVDTCVGRDKTRGSDRNGQQQVERKRAGDEKLDESIRSETL